MTDHDHFHNDVLHENAPDQHNLGRYLYTLHKSIVTNETYILCNYVSRCETTIVTIFASKWEGGVSIQYIPRNMHTVFALLCFVVVIHWLIFPYPSGLLHWHCGNLTIAPVPAKQPWWIWINTSCEFITNDCITTTKQSTTKQCAYLLGYTVLTTVLSLAAPKVLILIPSGVAGDENFDISDTVFRGPSQYKDVDLPV